MFFDVKLWKNVGNVRGTVQRFWKLSAKRENVGVWGHSPQEKFAVSNVCVVSFVERVVASLRLHGDSWMFVARARTPSARSYVAAAASARPDDEQGRTRRLGALLDAVRLAPVGAAWAPTIN